MDLSSKDDIQFKIQATMKIYQTWSQCLFKCLLCLMWNMSSLHYKKFTFCKYFVRVCGWCMHLVCYRSVQSRIMTVFFSILLPSKKEKNKFLLLSYFCKPWYDAIGKIYLSCHMFMWTFFHRIISKTESNFLHRISTRKKVSIFHSA